jgi:hypothetical protein
VWTPIATIACKKDTADNLPWLSLAEILLVDCYKFNFRKVVCKSIYESNIHVANIF